MSVEIDFGNLLNDSSTLTVLFDGGIIGDTAGNNPDFSKNYLIWGVERDNIERYMGGIADETYQAICSVYTDDNVIQDTLCKEVIDYLEGKSYGDTIFNVRFMPPQQKYINEKPDARFSTDLIFEIEA